MLLMLLIFTLLSQPNPLCTLLSCSSNQHLILWPSNLYLWFFFTLYVYFSFHFISFCFCSFFKHISFVLYENKLVVIIGLGNHTLDLFFLFSKFMLGSWIFCHFITSQVLARREEEWTVGDIMPIVELVKLVWN